MAIMSFSCAWSSFSFFIFLFFYFLFVAGLLLNSLGKARSVQFYWKGNCNYLANVEPCIIIT